MCLVGAVLVLAAGFPGALAVESTHRTFEDSPGFTDNVPSPPPGMGLQAVLICGPGQASHFELRPDGSFTYTPAKDASSLDEEDCDSFRHAFSNQSDAKTRSARYSRSKVEIS